MPSAKPQSLSETARTITIPTHPLDDAVADAVDALRDCPAPIARHGIVLRGHVLMQERPTFTRRLPRLVVRLVLDEAVSFEAPTRGGWRHVATPGNILSAVAGRAAAWVPLRRQLPVLPRDTPPTQMARVRLERALPGLRLEITAHDDAMHLLRVRYGEGREIIIATDQASELAGWLALLNDDVPLPFPEFSRPEWTPECRWSLRAWRAYRCARESRAAGAGAR